MVRRKMNDATEPGQAKALRPVALSRRVSWSQRTVSSV